LLDEFPHAALDFTVDPSINLEEEETNACRRNSQARDRHFPRALPVAADGDHGPGELVLAWDSSGCAVSTY
jgi:hypothetical protein